jgi:hypothetical protein
MEPLDRIRDAFLAHDKDVLIIVFLSSFCDNCNEGTLLREIKLLYESGRTDVAAITIRFRLLNRIGHQRTPFSMAFTYRKVLTG